MKKAFLILPTCWAQWVNFSCPIIYFSATLQRMFKLIVRKVATSKQGEIQEMLQMLAT